MDVGSAITGRSSRKHITKLSFCAKASETVHVLIGDLLGVSISGKARRSGSICTGEASSTCSS
jgi:hypothetical protein